MNTLKYVVPVLFLAIFAAAPSRAQEQRPCPAQYGVYYRSAAGWEKLPQITSNSSPATQSEKTSALTAPMKITDHRPTFCIRQPVASVNAPGKPDPVVLIKFDKQKSAAGLKTPKGAADSGFTGYSQDQLVQTHLARADEEGLFTISSTSDLASGEYLIIIGSEKSKGYDFAVR